MILAGRCSHAIESAEVTRRIASRNERSHGARDRVEHRAAAGEDVHATIATCACEASAFFDVTRRATGFVAPKRSTPIATASLQDNFDLETEPERDGIKPHPRSPLPFEHGAWFARPSQETFMRYRAAERDPDPGSRFTRSRPPGPGIKDKEGPR